MQCCTHHIPYQPPASILRYCNFTPLFNPPPPTKPDTPSACYIFCSFTKSHSCCIVFSVFSLNKNYVQNWVSSQKCSTCILICENCKPCTITNNFTQEKSTKIHYKKKKITLIYDMLTIRMINTVSLSREKHGLNQYGPRSKASISHHQLKTLRPQ